MDLKMFNTTNDTKNDYNQRNTKLARAKREISVSFRRGFKTPSGKHVLNYLHHKGYSNHELKTSHIGYIPKDKTYASLSKYDQKLLNSAHFINGNQGGMEDRLIQGKTDKHGRIIDYDISDKASPHIWAERHSPGYRQNDKTDLAFRDDEIHNDSRDKLMPNVPKHYKKGWNINYGAASFKAKDVSDDINKYYHHELMHSPKAKPVLDYLHKQGFSNDYLNKNHVGYAPKSKQGIYKREVSRGFSPKQVRASKLVDAKGRDKFHDQITESKLSGMEVASTYMSTYFKYRHHVRDIKSRPGKSRKHKRSISRNKTVSSSVQPKKQSLADKVSHMSMTEGIKYLNNRFNRNMKKTYHKKNVAHQNTVKQTQRNITHSSQQQRKQVRQHAPSISH